MSNKQKPVTMTAAQFLRHANNHYLKAGVEADLPRLSSDMALVNSINQAMSDPDNGKKKVAFLWICTGAPYWEYAVNMLKGAQELFLPGHDVDYFLWSDIPESDKDQNALLDKFVAADPKWDRAAGERELKAMSGLLHKSCKVTFTEAAEWPLPTLMRYHLFLQREEELKNYDYVFYCDVDMQFANVVGDEILGDGLTAALHPGYAVDKKFVPPYEPNPQSEAFIPRPGRIVDDGGKPRFRPEYYAGGLQGGTSESFIKAMKAMKASIDKDYNRNYVAIWNDESHWNKHLFTNPPSVVLGVEYIHPDSLIAEYYHPLWGRKPMPRLYTLTKKFSLTKEGGEAAKQMTDQLGAMKA